MNSSSDRKAVAAAVICNALWGLSFLASRIALDTTPVFIILSHRFLLAFLAMSVLLLTPFAEIHLRGKSLWPLLLLGLMQPVIYFLGELYGILHSTTIFSGVMISVIPIAGVLAAVLFLKEIPSVTQIVFCVLAVSGVVGIGLLSHNSGSLEWSGVLGLVLAVCAAVAYTILNRSIAKTYTVFERTYIMMGGWRSDFHNNSPCFCEGRSDCLPAPVLCTRLFGCCAVFGIILLCRLFLFVMLYSFPS